MLNYCMLSVIAAVDYNRNKIYPAVAEPRVGS